MRIRITDNPVAERKVELLTRLVVIDALKKGLKEERDRIINSTQIVSRGPEKLIP